jgi:hypothetical protein
MIGWGKTQIDVERLTRLLGRTTDERQPRFFLTAASGSGHRPASTKIRRTVPRLTSGTH